MSEEQTTRCTSAAEPGCTARKPYQKAAFREESLFETGALSCGKVQSTQSGCHANRKTSYAMNCATELRDAVKRDLMVEVIRQFGEVH